MNEATRCADVIDFFWGRRRREGSRESVSIAALALDRCEAMFQQRNWKEFAYWHAIYCRARSASQRVHCCDNDVSKSIVYVFSLHDAQAFGVFAKIAPTFARAHSGSAPRLTNLYGADQERPVISPELTTGHSNVDTKPAGELGLGATATVSV